MSQSPSGDARLPPTPRWPQFAQNIAYLTAGRWFMTRMTKRHGTAFTMRIPVFGPTVTVTDPVLAKALFQQPGDALQGVDANLGLVLGAGSTFGLQGEKHRAHRKLILPQFHGNRMRSYEGLIEEEVLQEVLSWPEGREFSVLPSTMRITLNSILRALFGADGPELDALRELLPRMVKAGQRLAILPWLRRDWGPWSPWGRCLVMRGRFDRIVGALIDDALADAHLDRRTDVLSLLVQARYDDGTPMSRSDITDELLTLVVAGHETTANELAWAFERLRRHPHVLSRLTAEIDAGGSDLLQATVQEVLRTRPVIDGSARKVLSPSIQLGPWVIPEGYNVAVSISLMHFNELVYDDATAFKPDRFLGKGPDLYAWLPFGGGSRRCLGATFADMEMQVVLRTILKEFEVVPTNSADERWRYKGVAFGPGAGGKIMVHRRRRTPTTQHPVGGSVGRCDDVTG